ncbi:MAG: alpha/beta hydrolase [Peptococcaceae bacterium]|nr:alpha/beta hydrolase [Peptococcaceae bacterium]
MMPYLLTKNQYIIVDGQNIAYREMGKGKSELPLVMLTHLAATLDQWDPKLIDLLSETQHVILLELPGVGASQGKVASTVPEMARETISILNAMGYQKINLLGLSMGGMIAQEIVRLNNDLVNCLILVGTAPRGGVGVDHVTRTTFCHVFRAILHRADLKRFIFYTPDRQGKIEAEKVFGRMNSRLKENTDKPMAVLSFLRQLRAIKRWSEKPADDLRFITQPTLIVNGDQDRMIPMENSYFMHQKITGSKLVIYSHAGHGSLFQYADAFAGEVGSFLKST